MPAISFKGSGYGKVPASQGTDITRSKVVLSLLLLIFAVFIIRAFYLQVIRHDYYSKAALNYQFKEYLIPAERGVILARNGNSTVPVVLNEVKFTLFADPVYVSDPDRSADALSSVLSIDRNKLVDLLNTSDTRYVVLSKKLSREQRDAIENLELKGIGTREEVYRTYPQGGLAAQTLGFVNDEGVGQYGIEQYMDEILRGKPGELRAITDAQGVPLVSNPDNVIDEPEAGRAVTLSIDIGLQKQAEDILKNGLERSLSNAGSLLVMRPDTGKIVAMANYPSYDPSSLSEVSDLSVLSNANTDKPIEIGSIMKVLTVASAIDQGVVSANTEFYDPGFIKIGDHRITDVTNSEGTQSVESVLVDSLNTGAVWLLQQIGKGGINERARFTWYEYMTKHYQLGSLTGIEQAGEAAGIVPEPDDTGQGVDVIYANTSFGQGMLATPVQMGAAFSSIINGGAYYKPSVVDSVRDARGHDVSKEPEKIRDNVVSEAVSEDILNLTEQVANKHFPSMDRRGYRVGGKTGTAEIAKPEGGYYKDRYNGTYMGYLGGDKPEYVIVVTVIEPKVPGFAGSRGAAPIFADTVNMLLNNVGLSPRS